MLASAWEAGHETKGRRRFCFAGCACGWSVGRALRFDQCRQLEGRRLYHRQTGEFWHCAAGSIYQGGISFAVMIGAAAGALIDVVFQKYRIYVVWS
jgi:hypothetical protein